MYNILIYKTNTNRT